MSTASPELRDLVREDPDLTPAEKETALRFAKDEDRATVFTAEAGLTRRLLAHAEFAVEEVVLADGSHAPHVEALDASEDAVVGVRGTLPVGCLKVRASSRSPGGHARMVTHPGNSRLGGGE